MQREFILSNDYIFGDALNKVLAEQPQDLINIMKKSGLRGRGGAGFPTGLKLELVSKNDFDKKYVVCNADEGEPGSFKDRELLFNHTEKFIEGMIASGYAVGSSKGFIYLRAEYKWMLKKLLKKIEQLREKSYLGKSILNKNFDFDIEIRCNAGAYICGEESSLIESMEGKRGEPRNRPPFPVEHGYVDSPTLVDNVETFANLPYIVKYGDEEFKKYGTEKSPGTKLFSISGDCLKPGIYEFELGCTLFDLLEACDATDVKAVQVGGAAGITVAPKDFNTSICYSELPPEGSIIIFNNSRNMFEVLKNFTDFFKEESCGLCTPCREGVPKIADAVDKFIRKENVPDSHIEVLMELADVMKVASKCGLGQTASNPFVYIYKNFGDSHHLS